MRDQDDLDGFVQLSLIGCNGRKAWRALVRMLGVRWRDRIKSVGKSAG